MVALVVLGVPLNTVLLLGAGVLVVLGVALQQSLRDLAATVNFILFKHFEPGDYIETNGISGTVQEIELLNTTILRADRKVAVLPNSKIQQEGWSTTPRKTSCAWTWSSPSAMKTTCRVPRL